MIVHGKKKKKNVSNTEIPHTISSDLTSKGGIFSIQAIRNFCVRGDTPRVGDLEAEYRRRGRGKRNMPGEVGIDEYNELRDKAMQQPGSNFS